MSERIEATEAIANAGEVDAEDFAKLIADSSREQLEEVVNGPNRKRVLDEIFGRMTDHVDKDRAQGLNAIVHFKILDRPEEAGGGYDHYEVLFDDGSCRATDQPTEDPQVTIRVRPVDFLKLAANQASGPTLFLTVKLKLEGDVMLASRLTSFFRIPTAG